jgi:hypothetical protein
VKEYGAVGVVLVEPGDGVETDGLHAETAAQSAHRANVNLMEDIFEFYLRQQRVSPLCDTSRHIDARQ